MNQYQASDAVAKALHKQGFTWMHILFPIQKRWRNRRNAVVMCEASDGTRLSVTVEILAQP